MHLPGARHRTTVDRECRRELPRFRGWSCLDRNGRSNELAAAAAAAALSFNGRDGTRPDAPASGAGTIMRGILGDELTALGESTLGLDSYHFFLLFLTLMSGVVCCGLCVAARLGRAACVAACVKSRRAKSLARARRSRPMRLAAEEDEHGEDDDDILGDED